MIAAALVGLAAGSAAGEASPARKAARAKSGSVRGQVEILVDGKAVAERAGVVITLEDVPGAAPEPMRAQVRQKNKRFEPALTVVTKGSTIDFPNQDKIFHNVFSVSRAARFDLGLYRSGASKSVELKRTGDVDVYCNIHPEMVAKIKVVDTRYHAVTDADGRFRIDGVPPGTYPIVAWHASGNEYRGQVTVKPGQVAVVNVSVTATHKQRGHLRKDGTPYGRYR